MNYTSYLKLRKPLENEHYDVNDDNFNADIIDTAAELANKVYDDTSTSAGAITITGVPGVTKLSDLLNKPIQILVKTGNGTTTSQTVGINGLTAVLMAVGKSNSSTPSTVLEPYTFAAGDKIEVMYNGTNFVLTSGSNSPTRATQVQAIAGTDEYAYTTSKTVRDAMEKYAPSIDYVDNKFVEKFTIPYSNTPGKWYLIAQYDRLLGGSEYNNLTMEIYGLHKSNADFKGALRVEVSVRDQLNITVTTLSPVVFDNVKIGYATSADGKINIYLWNTTYIVQKTVVVKNNQGTPATIGTGIARCGLLNTLTAVPTDIVYVVPDTALQMRCAIVGSNSVGSNPWFLAASVNTSEANKNLNVVFYVYESYMNDFPAASGILRVGIRTSSSVSTQSAVLTWDLISGFNPDNFVIVCNNASPGIMELWVKNSSNYRFIILEPISEGIRGERNQNTWTLYQKAEGKAAPTASEGYTQKASTISSLKNPAMSLVPYVSGYSGSNIGYWTKLVTMVVSARYQDANFKMLLTNSGDNYNKDQCAILGCRVWQNNALGGTPDINLWCHTINGNWYVADKFMAIIVEMSTTQTVVEIFYKAAYTNQYTLMSLLGKYRNITVWEGMTYSAALPAGTQIVCDDNSGYTKAEADAKFVSPYEKGNLALAIDPSILFVSSAVLREGSTYSRKGNAVYCQFNMLVTIGANVDFSSITLTGLPFPPLKNSYYFDGNIIGRGTISLPFSSLVPVDIFHGTISGRNVIELANLENPHTFTVTTGNQITLRGNIEYMIGE